MRSHARNRRRILPATIALCLLTVAVLVSLIGTLAFFMVLNYHFASGAMFHTTWFTGGNGLAYVLVYPVLVAGRAGVVLGLDGALGRTMMRSGSRL